LPNDQGFDEWYGIPRTTDESFWPSSPAAKAAGVRFTYVMEGHKGERSRELAVYDLEQRRLIDAEITRRTIDFMRRSVQTAKPFYANVPFKVHFPTLPNPKFAGKTGFGDFPTPWGTMATPACYRGTVVLSAKCCGRTATSLGEGMDIGEDVGSAVDFTYKLPFKFTGAIDKVTIELK
jgi:hypothetical protein